MKKIFQLTIISILLLVLAGCNSSKTSGGGEADGGSIFVSSEDAVGRVRIDLNSDTVAVGSTVGFFARVFDKDGNPVSNFPVACDSERELAIIEPSSGSFITNTFGDASGVLGCVNRGSFRFGCRVPLGGAEPTFVTVKCTGDVPDGFTGFPGAGGGTLGIGNGVATTDGVLSVTQVSLDDGGEAGTTSIDIVFNADCNADGVFDDPELFTDTLATITIANNDIQNFFVDSFRYTVTGDVAGGSPLSSGLLRVAGVIPGQSTGDITAVVFNAHNGFKTFVLSSSTTSTALSDGVSNIRFDVSGTLADGTPFTITGSRNFSADNFDRC